MLTGTQHARPRSGRARIAVSVLALCFGLVSCSGQIAGKAEPGVIVTVTVTASGSPLSEAPDSSGVTQLPDACSLLTQTQAQTLANLVLQKPVGAGNPGEPAIECQFTTDPNGAHTGQVTLEIGDGAEKTYQTDKTTLQHKFTKVSGIADEAWREDDAIFVRKGTTWAAILLVLLNKPEDNVSRLITAARQVAARL